MKQYFSRLFPCQALCLLVLAALLAPVCALGQEDPAVSPRAEEAKTVCRTYFKQYFMGDPASASLLGPENDLAEYEKEMAQRSDMIHQLGITGVDWSGLKYSLRMLDGDQAVVMAVGSIEVQTAAEPRKKDIQRVFKLEDGGSGWKIASSYYGDYKDEQGGSYSEEKLKRIENQIAKDRLTRYENMYSGVRKPYDPQKDPEPGDNPETAQP